MKPPVYFMASLLLGWASTAPTFNDDTKLVITEEFLDDKLVIYTAEHEIVNLLLPLNGLNFEYDVSDNDELIKTILFFVLADTEDGKRVYKGLYMRKNGVVTKLLDNGVDAAATNDDTRPVYFAATDGLYFYNEEENKAEKYGTVTDSIISMAVVNGSDVIYILTEEHVLYKVTEEGTKKEKVEEIVDAQKIVLDYENNLYYYTADKNVYVWRSDGVKQIEGLPTKDAIFLDIIKPPFLMEKSIPVLIDDTAYIALSNGTGGPTELTFKARPTAFSMEATLIEYFAYNKKIYEYNVLTLLFSELSRDIKFLLKNKPESMERIANLGRNDMFK